MSEKLTCEELILGAGVIGLAVASRQGSPETFLIEAHTRFGCETSSRNSEVIHSGIHYPVDSWKTRLCLEGQKKLYAFCEQNGVPHAPCGKLTVARAGEEAQLDPIAQRARLLGVEFEEWTGAQVAAAEPAISETSRALFFPRTGIIDSHVLMAVLEKKALAKGATVAYSHRLLAAERTPRGWLCQVQSPDGEFEIEARTVINAAGLGAARLSNQALQTSKYEHRFCRGRYFTLSGKYRGAFKKLIYPVPQRDGLGVHTTIDLEGFARLGPDVDWCPDSNPLDLTPYYRCEWDDLRDEFVTAARKLIPTCEAGDLTPGTIGLRPKLFIDGNAHPDFLIEEHQGWIHCLGVESPGLTSSLAIAERVAGLCSTTTR